MLSLAMDGAKKKSGVKKNLPEAATRGGWRRPYRDLARRFECFLKRYDQLQDEVQWRRMACADLEGELKALVVRCGPIGGERQREELFATAVECLAGCGAHAAPSDICPAAAAERGYNAAVAVRGRFSWWHARSSCTFRGAISRYCVRLHRDSRARPVAFTGWAIPGAEMKKPILLSPVSDSCLLFVQESDTGTQLVLTCNKY